MESRSYFLESWRMLTRNKGWAKPVLVMAAASLVPVAGALGNDGYALEWARLSAWGVDSSPKQKNVDVVKCIESGWRGFVAGIGWTLAFSIVGSMINALFGVLPGTFGELLSALVAFVVSLGSALMALVAKVASVRATIYQKASAGYRIETIWEMIRRDTEGFLKVFVANLLCMLAMAMMGIVLAGMLVAELFPFIIQLDSITSDAEVFEALSKVLVPVVLTCAVFGYGIGIVANAIDLVVTNAIGLWMSQFDVPSWGPDEEPLPQANQAAWYGWTQEADQWQGEVNDVYELPAASDDAPSDLAEQVEEMVPEPDAYDIPLVPADQAYTTPEVAADVDEDAGLAVYTDEDGAADATDGIDDGADGGEATDEDGDL